MVKNKKISINECIEVLKLAMYSVEEYIPHEIIETTIGYLNEYSYRKSWDGCSEDMGR